MREGIIDYYDSVNNGRVITNGLIGSVVTVMPGTP